MKESIEITINGQCKNTITRNAVASIDTEQCINCGKCRRACPTEAISEYQRPICRLCADCGEGPEMFPSEIRSYAAEHSCSIGCPLGTIPEGYINMIKAGRYEDAYELISELNPLPSTCARVCHHPCEAECKRGLLLDFDKPLAIRTLKRFVTDRVEPYRPVFNRKYDYRVAIIGAGPAGITAAFDLAKKGYEVKVFEAAPKPGGMARKCIPDFRLNKSALQAEFEALENAGIEIEYNAKVGKNPTIAQLKEKFDAIIVAVGASKGFMLPVAGLEGNPYRVYDAVTFMERVNSGMPIWSNGEKPKRKDVDVNIGKKAVVIGGGSVAIDAARTLVRMGIDKITCVCLESGDDMPAPRSEIDDAREEGVEIICSASPTKVNCAGTWVDVESVDFKKVDHIEHDEKGRIKPVLSEDGDFTLQCDSIIFAVGQKADVTQLAAGGGLELADGHIKFDDTTLETSVKGVFVAGDVVEARGSIISAMASGRKAALSVDNMLQDRQLSNRIEHTLHSGPQSEWIYRIQLEDVAPQQIPKLRYHDTFEELELGFDERTAVTESRRCMKCGYENVDTEKCIGCGVCANICPVQAITMARSPKEVEQ